MSFLSDILEKVGLKPVPGNPMDRNRPPAASTPVVGTRRGAPGRIKRLGKRPEAISNAELVRQLDQRSGGNSNWKVSVVELLSLLKMDSSLEARKKMAIELGYAPAKVQDTAKMNNWLHKKLMRKLANHGGKMPPRLLD